MAAGRSIRTSGNIIDIMRFLELRVPPPVVALLVALAMWGASRESAAPAAPDLVRVPLAIALAVVGAAFDVSGFLAFRRARTTINPMKPRSASSLVESGVYRVTRNPMYVGLLFMLCGWTVFLWSWWALPGPLAFAAYIGRFQIAPEEKALAALFGARYLAYKARVRRWL
ncbi:protein-S-isoprenylcysteine O-methyltransferase [Burkholderiales bacterium]|nr:protein-S-isoprenylcysteine O-methyltransferase [Burkholderiales bacterium]